MKLIFAIAWRNLWRNTRRTILSVLAIAFSVVVLLFFMCLQQGSYKDMIRNAVNVHTGFLQVQHEGYLKDKNLEKAFRGYKKIFKILDKTKHVTGYAPRINAPVLASFEDHTSGAMIFGIDPDKEKNLSTISKVIQKGRYLEKSDQKGVLVGETLAKNLQVDIGDKVAYMGQGADGSLAAGLLEVMGIFKSGSNQMDRSTLFANLDNLDESFSMYGGVHEIAIKIDDLRNLDTVQSDLAATIQKDDIPKTVVLTWDQVLPGVKQGIDLDWQSAQIFYVILMMVVGFGIMNTFLMSFLERTREFGVLMSIGMLPGKIARLIFIEAMLLTAVGLVTGLIGGSALTYYYEVKGISLASMEEMMAEYGMSATMYPELSWWLIRRTSIFIVVVSAIVALYPAIKVMRLQPVDALRSV